MQVFILGCGAIGSNLALELARKCFSTSTYLNIVLLDYDVVERRNLAAQAFLPKQVGLPKVDAVEELIEGFSSISVSKLNLKLTEENLTEIINLVNSSDDASILIDCFDNLEARNLAWKLGQVLDIPVLHVGMSEKGSGYVSWSMSDYDTFPLSPKNTNPKRIKEITEAQKSLVLLPPCELNGFRSLVLNTSLAAANAIFIYLGIDNSQAIGPTNRAPGFRSNWATTNNTITFLKQISM
jgi:molybdopterin/thiamine biosynthesis adenylyltransferase